MSTQKRKGRVVAKRAVHGLDNTIFASGPVATPQSPVFVLPADAASVERMVEQVAFALIEKWGVKGDQTAKVQYYDDARTALAAIGIGAIKAAMEGRNA